MSFVVIFLIVTSIAAGLAKIFNKKIDITVPISIMLIVLIIYPFGFFNRLEIGVYVVEGISAVCLLYLIYKFIKSIINKSVLDFFKNLLTPGMAVYILFYIFFIFINKDRLLSNWDEFSHWGLIVKNMFSFDSYGTNIETTLRYKGYPPFTSICEYFTQKVVNSYSEGRIIVSMNLIYISMVLPVFRNIDWKKGLSKLLIYVPLIFILPLLMYSDFYTTIYVDAILGIFMAYILYTYFTMEDGLAKNLSICLGLISLTLIKTAGSGLAIFIIAIIFIDILYKYKKDKENKKIFHKKLIYLLIYLVCFIIGKYSWELHLILTNTTEAWNTEGVSINNIISLITGNDVAYRYTVIKNFIKQFFLVPIDFGSGQLTNFTILLVFVLYGAYTIYLIYRKKDGDVYKRYILTEIMLVVFYLIYMISMLVLYLFTFSEYEALRLASYTRYSYITLIGMFTFNTLLICDNLLEIKKDKINYIILCIIILAVLPINKVFNLLVNNNESINEAIEIRAQYSKIQEYKKVLTRQDMVYYISCGSNGFDFNVSNYEFVPTKFASPAGYSLGPPRYEGDLKSKDTSVDQLESVLIEDGFTYVYIYKADEIFKEKYAELFESEERIKNETLYKINKNGNDVELIEVIL